MLATLSIRDIVLIDRLDLDLAAGHDGAHGRNRRGQVDPARCARHWRSAGAAMQISLREPGRLIRVQVTVRVFDARSRTASGVPAPFCARTMHRGRWRRRALAAPGADGRRTQHGPFVNDQPVSAVNLLRQIRRACLVEIHGQHDDRAFLDPRHPWRACSMPIGGLEAEAAEKLSDPRMERVESRWRRICDRTPRNGGTGAPAARRDYLQIFALDELTHPRNRSRRRGRPTLAERRAVMMNALRSLSGIFNEAAETP